MPFQGNPNAGAIDPALIQMLFDARRQRTELALKQQDMQMRAQAEAEKQRRLEEKHALSIEADRRQALLDRVALAKSIGELGPQVDSARRHAEITTSKNFTEEDLFGGGGGEDFASMIAQLDPTAPAQLQASNESMANFHGTARTAAELYQGLDPSLDPQTAINAALGLGGATETSRARGVDLKVEEQSRTTAATEAAQEPYRVAANRRSLNNSLVVAREQASLAAGADIREIKLRENELLRLKNEIEGGKLTGDALELAENEYRSIRAQATADLTRGQNEAVTSLTFKQAEAAERYDRSYDGVQTMSVLEQAIINSKSPTLVGVNAWLTEVGANFFGVIQDVTGRVPEEVYLDTLRVIEANPDNSTEEVEEIKRRFFDQETLDAIANNQITEKSAQWWAMYTMNTDGRVSNMLSKEMQERSNIIGPGVSQQMALARIRAMRGLMDKDLRRQRSFIKKVDPAEAFDDDGRRVASESLPLPKLTPGATPPTGISPSTRRSAIDAYRNRGAAQ